MRRIIFLCHGNICRSVAAEWIARHYAETHALSEPFEIQSRACSSEEIGNDIYPPMKAALRRAGIPFGPHQARRLSQEDYQHSDVIYYMDGSNIRLLGYSFTDHKRIFKPIFEGMPFSEIEDPWYTGNFDLVVKQLSACIENIFRAYKIEKN